MPSLDGCLVVAKDVPSFVIPVFVERPGGNLPIIQEIDGRNRVSSFFQVDVGNSYENIDIKFEVDVGDHAIWAFRSLAGNVCFGDFAALKQDLKERLFSNEFSNFPLIEAQVAKFCNLASSYASALSKSYQLMANRSKLAASIWRDCSVLLPVARKELAQVIPKRLNSELSNIRLTGRGNVILLELPSTIHEFIGVEARGLNLEETLKLGNAFGLTSYAFQVFGTSPSAPRAHPTFHEPYGELASFTGIGDLVAKNGPSFRRVRRIVPPWVSKESRPSTELPLVTFCAINTVQATIDQALHFAAGRSKETIKMAIVTSPITFGTARGHKLDPRLLDSLRSAFDYIFVIANHILQMPTGAAPRLAASSRAVTYVKACVDGVMQLIWASEGPRTPKEFYAIFPRGGFGLVGRASGSKNTPPDLLLQKALGSALNERLALHYGRRLALIGPDSVVNDPRVLKFLDDAAVMSLNETVSVVSSNRRAAVTLLGFGVKVITRNEHRHREFCLELLRSRNFSIIRETDVIAYGEFAKRSAVAVGFASSEGSLRHVTAALETADVKTRFLLTDFALSRSGVNSYWRKRVAVFHYSLLDSYLEHRMSAPPQLRKC